MPTPEPVAQSRRLLPRILLVVAPVVVVAAVGVVAYQFRATVRNWFESEREDAGQLAGLRSADLRAPTVALAGGWPQWRGPNRDGVAPPGPLRTDWVAHPPAVVWSVPCGGGYSSFAVVNGVVYTQDRQDDRERVLALDAATGRELAAFADPADYAKLKLGYGAGPRATPTVDGDRVYALGATGVLTCLGPPADRPGAPASVVRWQRRLEDEYQAPVPQWGFASSPLVDGDLVVVQAGGKTGSVVAFDKLTGEPRWAAGVDPNGYSSPVVATLGGVRQIVAVTGTSVLGLRPADGTILWSHPWVTEFKGNIATPVVAGDYVFVSSNYSKGCTLLKVTANGNGAAVAEVYFRKNRVMRTHHSTCVQRDGFLYGFDNDTLRCVDLRTGVPVADWEGRDGDNRAIPKGTQILAGDHLIGLTQTGTLFLADADPAEFRFRGQVPNVLSGSDCWALPVLVDGRIYLRDHEKIVCLDVRPGT